MLEQELIELGFMKKSGERTHDTMRYFIGGSMAVEVQYSGERIISVCFVYPGGIGREDCLFLSFKTIEEVRSLLKSIY